MEARSFVGYEFHWITLDKLYLVVGLRDGLLGLRVGGQLMGVSQNRPTDPRSYFKKGWIERYQGRNLEDPSLVTLDARNFLIPSVEIEAAQLRRRRALWTGPVANSGRLVLRLRSGGRRQLILLGEQRHENVAATLAAAGIVLESPPGPAP